MAKGIETRIMIRKMDRRNGNRGNREERRLEMEIQKTWCKGKGKGKDQRRKEELRKKEKGKRMELFEKRV